MRLSCGRGGARPEAVAEVERMPKPIQLTFLGTGNFHATAGYWNSFLIGERILVETSPSVLRNIQVAGRRLDDIDVIFISHFHADHTFGWPLLSTATHSREGRQLTPVTWTDAPLWASSQLEGAPGLVEVKRPPTSLPATQSTVAAHETP